jgi:diguanylate cyclase (GGDEF)-like protein/PAS domain S-box-containing protein
VVLDEAIIPESVLRRSYAFERFGAPAAVLDATGVVVETNEAWRLFASLNEALPDTTGPGVDYLRVCDRAYEFGVETAGAVAAGLRTILDGERSSFELEYACPSPLEERWFLLHASTAPVDDGVGIVLFHVDISTRKLLTARLAQNADLDPLTGLPDRLATIRFIEVLLAPGSPLGGLPCAISVVVDGLDDVENELGHPACEELFVQVTARARHALRGSDILCRFGPRHLVVVCPDIDDDAAAAVVRRLRDGIATPFQVGTTEVALGVTVGVATARAGFTAQALLTAASAAATRELDVNQPAPRGITVMARQPRRAAAALHPETALALAAAHAQRDAVVAHSSELVVYFETDGTIAWASPATQFLFGIDVESLVGRNGLELIHPDDQERTLADFASITAFGDTVTCEFRVIADDGSTHWVEETATNLVDDPHIGYIVANLNNITARKRDEDAIRLQNRLLDAAGQAIIAFDMTGNIFYWNAAATEIYGWTADEARGRPAGELLSPGEGWADVAVEVAEHVIAGKPWKGDFLTTRKDGTEVPVFLTDTAVFDENGAQIGIIAVSSDITDRQKLELDLVEIATHDALTGLANRSLLLTLLDDALIARDGCVGLLLFDVDRFKLINDSLGHDRGDELLVAIAGALRDTIEPGDIAARFGDDSFAVVIPVLDSPDQALRLAARLQARLVEGLAVGDDRYLPTISVGMVITKAGDTGITALRDAETAMYRAKERGRDRAEWFDPSLRRDIVTSFEVERDLRQAICDDELFLEFQPVIDMETGEVASCEGLIRWNHPRRGRLGPDDFIPVAEQTGLIVSVGRWVLRHALTAARSWPDEVTIAVNLSPRELAEPDLVTFVKRTLADLDVAAARLVLEITETAVVEDPTAAARAISALRALGVGVIIDDFGTGYTSLSFLRDYQIDGLKIDRSYVTDLEHGSSAIVDAMIRMSSALGLHVIAEGIETDEQLAQLRALGCRYIQGFLLGEPVAPEDLPFGGRLSARRACS